MFRRRMRFELMLACVILSSVWGFVAVLILNANR